LDRFLSVFIHLWIGLIVLLNLVGIFTQFYLHGIGGGISYIQDTYSPFNWINYIFEVIALLPAIGAYHWRKKIRGSKYN